MGLWICITFPDVKLRFGRVDDLEYRWILLDSLALGVSTASRRVPIISYKLLVGLWLYVIGAGEGNRTLVSGLGSPHSTIGPHPH